MATLPETSTWETGVYQLETTDEALGGAGGTANVQALQLANRTLYLKDGETALQGRASSLESRATTLEGRADANDATNTTQNSRLTTLESRASALEALRSSGTVNCPNGASTVLFSEAPHNAYFVFVAKTDGSAYAAYRFYYLGAGGGIVEEKDSAGIFALDYTLVGGVLSIRLIQTSGAALDINWSALRLA